MARGTIGGVGDPNIFIVTLKFLLGLSRCQTSFKLRDKLLNDNTEQEVADEVNAQLAAAFRAMLTAEDKLEGVDAKIMLSDGGAFSNVAVQAGTLAIEGIKKLPTFTTANVAMKSEIRKRYGQGRMFLPVRSEDDVDGDSISQAGLNRINTFIAAMNTHFTEAGGNNDLILVTAHGILPARAAQGNFPGRPQIPASWYDVVSLRLNTLLTPLRSRKAGVGT